MDLKFKNLKSKIAQLKSKKGKKSRTSEHDVVVEMIDEDTTKDNIEVPKELKTNKPRLKSIHIIIIILLVVFLLIEDEEIQNIPSALKHKKEALEQIGKDEIAPVEKEEAPEVVVQNNIVDAETVPEIVEPEVATEENSESVETALVEPVATSEGEDQDPFEKEGEIAESESQAKEEPAVAEVETEIVAETETETDTDTDTNTNTDTDTDTDTVGETEANATPETEFPISPELLDQGTNTDDLLAQIQKELQQEKLIQKELIGEVTNTAPPLYTFVGAGLVYNCLGQHWACVDAKAYKKCEKNFRWTSQKSARTECFPENIYATENDCDRAYDKVMDEGRSRDICQK